jgi:ubiquinone/menaquinone biosynthesis C-methylase UbiE
VDGDYNPMIFPESKLAHKYLDGLSGIEIGGSAHNEFGLNALNIDFTDDMTTTFKESEFKMCGKQKKVDIVSGGDVLPLENESVDFVISSHVIEHFFDPIKTLEEWYRVIKPNGYIFIICPHKDRTFDKDKDITSLSEIIYRNRGEILPEEVAIDPEHDHWTIWNTESFLKFIDHLQYNVVEYLDVDDKVGNGFCVVIRKDKLLVQN